MCLLSTITFFNILFFHIKSRPIAMVKTVIVGITGASSSGKSTVCKALCNLIPGSSLVQQDAYFKEEKNVPYDETHKVYNWDCIEALDMPQMVADLKLLKQGGPVVHPSEMTNFKEDAMFTLTKATLAAAKAMLEAKLSKDTRIVFVDGFLMLADAELVDLFDLTFYVKTDYETLKKRRESRVYIVDGEEWVHPPDYFDQFVWKGYLDYHRTLFESSCENDARKTGGKLLESFKSAHHVVEVSNDNTTDFNTLILGVVNDMTKVL